jgi:hypothetical protein
MVITCIKLKGTPIMKGIKISKVRKLKGDGDGAFLFCMAIKNLNLMTLYFQ